MSIAFVAMTAGGVRDRLSDMTPDDFAALLKWSYANDDGSGWLPAAARDLRINERNLRGMMAGSAPIPAELAEVVCIMTAARMQLNNWKERRAALLERLVPIGADTLELVEEWRDRLRTYGPWNENPT